MYHVETKYKAVDLNYYFHEKNVTRALLIFLFEKHMKAIKYCLICSLLAECIKQNALYSNINKQKWQNLDPTVSNKS